MDCSVLGKWDELDQIKQKFNYLKTETLYSLQCVPIEVCQIVQIFILVYECFREKYAFLKIFMHKLDKLTF